MNIALLYSLISRYNELAFTHNYIFGFTYKGNVYMTVTTNEILPFILKVDKASRGAGLSLRYKPTNKQKILLLENSTLLCSVDYLNDLKENSRYNFGEIFEKMVHERFGKNWKKDNVPFTKGGDIEINGKAYQIKFEKATFASEKTLENFEK